MLSLLSSHSTLNKNRTRQRVIANKCMYFTFDNFSGDTLTDEYFGLTATSNNSAISSLDFYKGAYSAGFSGVLSNAGANYRTVSLPATGTLGTGGITISFWMKRIGDSSADYWLLLMGNWVLYGYATGGIVNFNGIASTNYTVPLNTWTHYVMTLTTTNILNAWANNVRIISNLSVSSSSAYNSNGYTGTLGGTNAPSSSIASFNGYIDEFRIYKGILQNADVAALYYGYSD